MSELLIRGGTVVDGSGGAAIEADVRVSDGVIAEVGPGLEGGSGEILDAGGAVVTPGFIDNHTHFDPTLYWDPFADPMPQHGVTSVLIGNCSLSLVPSTPSVREVMSSVFSFIEDIPLQVFNDEVPWNWDSYAEYRDVTSRGGLGVNVASLIGHTPLRLCVMGPEAWDRAATEDERARIAALLDASLRDGAFGLSTSFFDEDAHGRPVPSRLADDQELRDLFAVLAKHQAFVEFIPDVTRPDLLDDVDRIARLAGECGVLSTWNGCSHDSRRPNRGTDALARTSEIQAAGVRQYPQVSPRTFDLHVNWSNSMMFMKLAKSWHELIRSEPDEKRRMLADPAWREIARTEWDAEGSGGGAFPVHRLECVRLTSVSRPENRRWLGSSLADLVNERGQHGSDVLADWMLENDLDPGVVAVGFLNADPDGVAELLCHPSTIVGASDAGAHLQMMCASGDSTLLLTRHVRERGDMTLERAVHELTGRQADLFNFSSRGRIAPGKVADLTVFALDELAWLPEVFVDDMPSDGGRFRRPAGGYRYTVVDGVVVQEGGELTGARPGSVIAPI